MNGRRVQLTGATDAMTGAVVHVRRGRGPRVLFLPHYAACPECRAWIAALAAHSAAIKEWGGHANIVLHEECEHVTASEFPEQIQVLCDAGETLGAAPAAVIIADEWGEIYFAAEAITDHALPDPTEVVEWVRFISIHCPECEQPEGEWRSMQ